ncbi:MAG: ankyrin repeat domain-containing protein, partial [bacterium]
MGLRTDSGRFDLIKTTALSLLLLGCLIAPGWAGPVSAALKTAVEAGDLAAVKTALAQGADPDGVWKHDNIGDAPGLFFAISQSQPDIVHALLEGGANPNATRGGDAVTAMAHACTMGDLTIVQDLVGHGAKLDVVVPRGGAHPLGYAAAHGQLEVCRYLLSKGAPINQLSDHGDNALYLAEAFDHFDLAAVLLGAGGAPFNCNADGDNTWSAAIRHGDAALVTAMLNQSGPTPPSGTTAALDDGEWRPPLFAAAVRGYTDIVQELVAHGADPFAVGTGDRTALTEAVWSGSTEMVTWLLDQGGDAKYRKSGNMSLLRLAVDNDKPEMVALLLKRGADPMVIDQDQWNPPGVAVRDDRLDCVIAFLDNGVPVNASSPFGSLLWESVGHNHPAITKELIKHGGDVNQLHNTAHTSPLYTASEQGFTDEVALLLAQHADTEVGDPDGWRPLELAIRNNHVDVFKLLYPHGGSANRRTTGGTPYLMVAVQAGAAEIITFLLDHGADGYALEESSGKCALDIAKEKGMAGVVARIEGARKRQFLLWGLLGLAIGAGYTWWRRKHTPVELPAGVTAPALWSAASHGEAETVAALIKGGANPGATNREGVPALSAAASGGHAETVALLIKYGANPDVVDADGLTAACVAARAGQTEALETLAENGANVLKAASDGTPPICYGAAAGHADVVELLLKRGASPNAVDGAGVKALWLAVSQGHAPVVSLLLAHHATLEGERGSAPLLFLASELGHVEVLQVLLEAKASPNASFDDLPALWRAAERGRQIVCETLLDAGAAVDTIYEGTPLLIHAIEKGQLWLFDLLMRHGVDVNKSMTGGLGSTPLMAAVRIGNGVMVERLLDAGADPTSRDLELRSALDVAKSDGHKSIVT